MKASKAASKAASQWHWVKRKDESKACNLPEMGRKAGTQASNRRGDVLAVTVIISHSCKVEAGANRQQSAKWGSLMDAPHEGQQGSELVVA